MTHCGTGIRAATYQIRARARALRTNSRPRKDKLRECQASRQFATESILGRQFSTAVTHTYEHTQDFDEGRRPLERNRGV